LQPVTAPDMLVRRRPFIHDAMGAARRRTGLLNIAIRDT
jgi:hypothetical protein